MTDQQRILLAVNSSQFLDLIPRALQAAGFEVMTAADRTGLDKAVNEATPALVIISQIFDDHDGLEIAGELLERFPTLPIILYAGVESAETAIAVIRRGIAGYLYPPLKIPQIMEEIQRVLDRARHLGDWVRREVKRTTSSLSEKAAISEAERGKLEAIITNIQDGVIVIGNDGKILLANRTVCEVFGVNGSELPGKPLAEAIPILDLQILIDADNDGRLQKLHEIHLPDGRVYNAQYAPVPRVGTALTIQDISYLKKLDQLKNDFINSVSHDLRSPLTSVMGYTQLLERVGPLNETQREFVQRLQGSIQHITNLVNDLLDLSRIEAGFDHLSESVAVDVILRNSLEMFDTQIRKKNINLAAQVGTAIKPMRANPVRIRQLIDNLVGNAVKYTPEGGSVQVGLFQQENQIILRVQDSGPGIPAEEQGHVFDKFFRASNAPDGVRGTGLGLSIVKTVVDNHHGRVWVESNASKGSTFIVLLPSNN